MFHLAVTMLSALAKSLAAAKFLLFFWKHIEWIWNLLAVGLSSDEQAFQ